jgi:cytoskeletal protein CcmA (bactofilin family)
MTIILSTMPVTVFLSALLHSWCREAVAALRSDRMSWLSRARKPSASRGSLGALIGEGCHIEGRCLLTGTVMLDGTFRGELACVDTLIIGEQASVSASVRSATVIVNGEVRGNVEATERIELARSGRVVGDLRAPVIVLEEGASLEGHCLTQAVESRGEAPALVGSPLAEGRA